MKIRSDVQSPELSPLQMSTLYEIANIGVSHAATSLSLLTSSKISISLPEIQFLPINRMVELVGSGREEVVVGHMEVMGGTPGNLLLIFGHKDALSILDLLLGRPRGTSHTIAPLERQAFKQLSVILSSSYLYAMAQFLKTAIIPGDPHLYCDRIETIIS
ncbi:MAG: chemotaxis protein CheC, partial [Armatimonadetes bacterium]|nr:chemotaxis protein CheC [Armatimonadota bacterium]